MKFQRHEDELRFLRLANAALTERVQKLEEALQPFLMHASSEKVIDLRVDTAWIIRGRQLVSPPKGMLGTCDGNHGGDPCDDPQCWQREEPWPWPNTKDGHA